jgi:hypothetical protein
MITPISPHNEQTLTFLRQLATHGFWGAVTLKFENGHVVHVRKEQNFKPDQLLPETRRYENDYASQ